MICASWALNTSASDGEEKREKRRKGERENLLKLQIASKIATSERENFPFSLLPFFPF
jgi:hypothetical protein